MTFTKGQLVWGPVPEIYGGELAELVVDRDPIHPDRPDTVLVIWETPAERFRIQIGRSKLQAVE